MNIVGKLKGLMVVPVVALAVAGFAAPVHAADCANDDYTLKNAAKCAKTSDQSESLFGGENGVFNTISKVLIFLVGAISVIMLIFGGVRYTVSGGDQKAVEAAKNTILYAIIGIIVAILAYAVVEFVISSISSSTGQ